MPRGIKILICAIGLLLLSFILFVPVIGFDEPKSTVLLDSGGELLGAKIADDSQWRFPASDSIPDRFVEALVRYEDKRFFLHHGIDIISLMRALWMNLSNRKIVSGASTISMQLARMYGKNRERNLLNKLYEMLLAVRLEFSCSKNAILRLYASNAPFGGNTVGLDAAAWRYYGKNVFDLSWAEVATLAVLPNSPGLIHPGRNRDDLKLKRDFLLGSLRANGVIDKDNFELALMEELPEKPVPLPMLSPHLTERLHRSANKGKVLQTFIDGNIQRKLSEIAETHRQQLHQNGIHNLAILLVENETGRVEGYIGNNRMIGGINHEYDVDMIRAGRSSGSILKPFLYAACIDEGLINPKHLLPDVPGKINGYRPRNFNRSFEGAVPADKALARSLNVPAVFLLRDYSIEKFIYKLHEFGFKSIDKNAAYYGLPLILGGADVSLWDLVGAYSSMARILNHFTMNESKYFPKDFHKPIVRKPGMEEQKNKESLESFELSAGAIWSTFQAMTKVERPNVLGKWDRYKTAQKIAWKTGTSYGFKDAWAVGVSKDYTLGVWVGNATGEGRPGLIGVQAAAPVLFEVFDYLPESDWFAEPLDDLKAIEICRDSGYPFSPDCAQKDTCWVPFESRFNLLCHYHSIIRVDKAEKWRVEDDCSENLESKAKSWFILPPLMEYFYAKNHPEYRKLPEFHPDCIGKDVENMAMALIYPASATKILIPVDFNGEQGRAIFKIAHRKPETKVFWYIDDEFIKTTQSFHEIEVLRTPGRYILTIVDENGEKLVQSFEIVK